MKNKHPLVSIIIINFNGLNYLKDCFESLEKVNYPNWEVIVVDNGSCDGSIEFLNRYKNFKSLKVVRNSSNLGFAKPNNQGYRVAKGKYVLLLNNDTRVNPDFLGKPVEILNNNKKIGVIQPKIFLMEKPGYLDNTGSFMTKTGFLVHEGYLEKDSKIFDKEKRVFATKGACMLIKREVIEKVGLFDNDFFAYFEESDFCWRVWLAGYEVMYYPKSSIFHKVGATSKNMNQFSINYHSLKNRIAALIKNLEFHNLFLILIPHLIILGAITTYYLLNLKFNKVKMVVAAFWWNIIHLPSVLNKRKIVQELRVVSDKEIFRKVGRKINILAMLRHFREVEKNF